ncbi:hypothetical protein GDO81_011175 [Engystomops pustulosus]|uniref:Fucosyltransferase n=1 Tax=Engystomops pustulosus TaxID=76066 RepID=A0AAV7BD15_ENGPU|nr:hypothetical protein GDO81_011175 [Engystomops pustulosus]
MNYYPIIVIVLFLLMFLFSFNTKYVNLTFKYLRYQKNIEPPIIPPEKETFLLVWNWPWGEQFSLDECEAKFGITGCKLTANRSFYDTADAVIVHHADIMNNRNLLPHRPRNPLQRWVWLNIEPPLIISNLHTLDNVFNMTMTFRHDSDIFTPYGHIVPLEEPQNITIPVKSKFVAWVVSQWYPHIHRTAYYEELRKYLPIDIYGAKHQRLNKSDFYPTISQYKFYLAFENSVYPDYITEKLWNNALGSWAVPVVLGTSRENYERFVPGEAFIHVNDFSSPKELAAYLLELDKNDVKYRKYFGWRSRYKVVPWIGWEYCYCKACETIKQGPRYQVIRSVAKWFLKDV